MSNVLNPLKNIFNNFRKLKTELRSGCTNICAKVCLQFSMTYFTTTSQNPNFVDEWIYSVMEFEAGSKKIRMVYYYYYQKIHRPSIFIINLLWADPQSDTHLTPTNGETHTVVILINGELATIPTKIRTTQKNKLKTKIMSMIYCDLAAVFQLNIQSISDMTYDQP